VPSDRWTGTVERIETTFHRLKAKGEKALVAYLTVGFPTLRCFLKLVHTCQEAGVDIMELGVPFSDPLADGPTIQAASEQALRQGVSLPLVLEMVERLRREGISIPLVLMTYINPVLAYGIRAFGLKAKASGVDGVIVPDLPPEEAGEWVEAAYACGLGTIFLASPTSPPERIARIVEISTGFLYYVSLTGVTGARKRLPEDVTRPVRMIRTLTELPICVGFGISQAHQVREVVRQADGAVVGSALLDLIRKNPQSPHRPVAHFVRRLKGACRGVS
jgi:tryptophan synthase alpha chain